MTKSATAVLHRGGISGFVVGLVPPVTVQMHAVPAARPAATPESVPMNDATRHVIIGRMDQLSTNCLTVRPR